MYNMTWKPSLYYYAFQYSLDFQSSAENQTPTFYVITEVTAPKNC